MFTGDDRLLTGAVSQARSAFQSHRSTPPSSPEFHENIKHANDVARLLRENVVQGARAEGQEEGGKYSKPLYTQIDDAGRNEAVGPVACLGTWPQRRR